MLVLAMDLRTGPNVHFARTRTIGGRGGGLDKATASSLDFSGNHPNTSHLLRQTLRECFPVLREMFPDKRSDAERLLLGECPD